MAQNYNVRLISDPLDNGESIFWNSGREEAFFVDTIRSELYAYMPKSHKIRKTIVGPKDSALGLIFAFPVTGKKNCFLGGFQTTIISFHWNLSKSNVPTYSIVKDLNEDQTPRRICGANVDPQGTLWVGTMGLEGTEGKAVHRKGALYSLMKGSVKKHDIPHISKLTGFAWDVKLGKMYLSDNLSSTICSLNYDYHNMEVSDKEDVLDVRSNGFQGTPHGLALDTYGFLWVAINGGSNIIQIDPSNRKLLQTIGMPTQQILSLTFGNKSLESLYITTSRQPISGEIPEHPAGCTCLIDSIGATGVIVPLYMQ